jgi:hypothetical protein
MRNASMNKAKGQKSRPKTKLGIPDLGHSKAAGASVLPTRGAYISMLSMSSWPGTVLNHDWPSTKQWCCAIAFTWRSAASRRGLRNWVSMRSQNLGFNARKYGLELDFTH